MDSSLYRELFWPIVFLLLLGGITILNIKNYYQGTGLKFYILDIFDHSPLYIRRPTKMQRRWLLLNIIADIILFEMFAIPLFALIVQQIPLF